MCEVHSAEDCPLYSAFLVTGVKVGLSPGVDAGALSRPSACARSTISWMWAISVMLELGQPVHVFDAKKIGGRKIVVRRRGRWLKTHHASTARSVRSNSRMLVISGENQPLVVAGIMGGANAEVDTTTTDIVVVKPLISARNPFVGLQSDSVFLFF